jgi:hypothetical protein
MVVCRLRTLDGTVKCEAAMVHPLRSYDTSIRGEIVYPPAFDVVNQDR